MREGEGDAGDDPVGGTAAHRWDYDRPTMGRKLVAGDRPTEPATVRKLSRTVALMGLMDLARRFVSRPEPPTKSKPSESTTSMWSRFHRTAAGCTQNDERSRTCTVAPK